MTMKPADDRVGERIRHRRHTLGKPLRVIAGIAGISHSTLSRMERGEIPCDNRFTLARLATALHCPVDYLTGVHIPGGPAGALTTAATHETVRALITADLEFPPAATGQATPIATLTEHTATVVDMRKACRYADMSRTLPGLVHNLYQATAGPDRGQALRLLVQVAEAASFAVRYTGQPAAASIAADRSLQAAQLTEDPILIGFGEWARAHAALGCGLHDRSALITARAITDLHHAPEQPGRPEMLGMLHLTHAFSLIGTGRRGDAVDALTEASTLAQHTGETDTLALMFGPLNCRLWELAIITDGGDPVDAIPLLADTNPMLIPSKSRQSAFYVDAGRLLAKTGDGDRATRMLETAERIAPERVHGDPIVVETVRGLLDAAHRRAVSTRLRGLAERIGAAV